MVTRVMRQVSEASGTRRDERRSLLQDHSGEQRVTNIELFFDLVYVFAVTQMSHHCSRPTVDGALQTALLLALVWWAWVYTTWATNWLDARRIPVRLMLIALMLVSLVLSAALPGAFGSRGRPRWTSMPTMQDRVTPGPAPAPPPPSPPRRAALTPARNDVIIIT